tara:strand:- start:811 stop:3864 length:3054 start_codon:yes stop_codon:yes gene_type:complete
MPVIRETRKIFSQPIGVRSFDTGEQNVGNAISRFADRAGQEFYQQAQINAEKFGAEAAQSLSGEELKSFDPETGKPEVLSSMDGMGSIASSAFEQVVERRLVDTIDKDIRLKSAELAGKYEDPVQYQNMFESFLGSMSKGANDRFKNVIMDSGSYIMKSTKIKLADVARTKARAAAAANVATTNNEFSETIFDQAASGNINAAELMIKERVRASQEAVGAQLYKPGYDEKVKSELGAQAMSGAIQVALQKATPIQQASLRVYIGSQGKVGGDLLTDEQLEVLQPFIGYVDRSNTSALLAQANVVSSNLNAVTAAKVAEQEALAKAIMLDFSIQYADAKIAPNRFGNVVASTSAWESGSPEAIAGSIGAASKAYEANLRELQDARRSGLGQDEYNAFVQDSRRAGLDSVIFGMASDGKIEALKTALFNPTPDNISILSPNQVSAISALTKTRLYDPTEDRNYVSTLLSGTQNAVQDKIDKNIRNANLFIEVEDVSTQFFNGAYNLEALLSAEEKANTALASGDITDTDYISLSNGLRSAAGKGIVNIVAGNMSSEELNSLSLYILSGRKEESEAGSHVTIAGDSILGIVPSDQISSVSNHANSVREKVAKKEAIIEQQRKEQKLQDTLDVNGGSVTNKNHRVAQSKRLSNAGFVLTDPSTYASEDRRAQLLDALRATPSQDLIDGLSNIALGLETPGADALLDLFSVLSNDPTSTGVFVNRFGSGEGAPISPKKTALLQTIASIRKITGKDAGEIALTLVERENDNKSDLAVKRVFGDQTPREFIANEYESDIIALDLADAAEYLARIGGSEKDVKTKIEELVDTYYHKTRVVVDPRFPVGELSRTMYSLEKVFPNEERRDAFINLIVSELPAGYRLRNYATRSPNRIQVSADIAVQGNLDLELTSGVTMQAVGDQPRQKDVYLVPNESTTGVAYYAYYVDDNNTLVPLYMNINGEQGIPMWDEGELADYDAQALIDRNAAIESDLDTRESVLKAVRKRPGMRSFSEIGNITFGSGGN